MRRQPSAWLALSLLLLAATGTASSPAAEYSNPALHVAGAGPRAGRCSVSVKFNEAIIGAFFALHGACEGELAIFGAAFRLFHYIIISYILE